MRNRLQPRRRSRITGRPKSRNYGCSAVQLRAQSPAAGNGIFGCRDRAPKSPLKCGNVGRDQNPRSEWPEIPAETPYSESYRKRAVCEDWMVVCAVRCEPISEAKIPITGKNTGKNAKISEIRPRECQKPSIHGLRRPKT